MADLAKLDLPAAFRYFSRSFQNPAEFTLCFTGSLQVCQPLCSSCVWWILTWQVHCCRCHPHTA